jgi:hypothetical protein
MLEYEDSEEIHYSDDEPHIPKRRNRTGILASVVLLLMGSLFFKSTLASNLTINSSGVVQFGQGQTATPSCAGSNVLTVIPHSSFVNSANGGTQMFSSVIVSGVPTSCYGKDLIINGFGDSNNQAASLFAVTSTEIVVLDNNGSFVISSSVSGLTITTNSTSSFTVTFLVPVSPSSSIYKLTVQSAANTILICSNGGSCNQGDKGPGGGTIVFAVFAGFPCGASMASTCHYIEMAPNTWSGLSTDPYFNNWAPNQNSITSTQSPNVGAGYSNSLAVYQANGSAACAPISSCTYAIQAAMNYSNSGYVDWFLPSRFELSVMCNYINGNSETSTNTVAAQGCLSVSGANAAGADAFKSNSVYWSSTEYIPNTSKAYTRYLVQSSSEGQDSKNNTLGSTYAGQYDNVRPIREF